MMAAFMSVWTFGPDATLMSVPREFAGASANPCIAGVGCVPGGEGFRMHWVSHTGGGELYLMVRKDCRTGTDCGALFVENTSRGLAARLNVAGKFQVLPRDNAVPDVQAWRPVRDNEYEVTRYRWSAGIFQKVEQRSVFFVDGRECGTALDCYSEAQAAHKDHQTDRALRILEKVHNVSYI